MSLTVFPQAAPAPSPFLKTLERGQQNFILSNIGAVQTFTGTVLPAGSIALAIPASRADEEAFENFTFQIDSGGGTPGAIITVLASLDGTTWYSIGALQAAGTYGIFFSAKALSTATGGSGMKVRYLSAYASTYAGSGGTTDSISVSIYA